MKFFLQKTFPQIYIASTIRTKSEVLVFSTNTLRLGNDVFAVKQGESVIFSYDIDFNLAPGIYDLRIGVYDGEKQKWLLVNHTLKSLIIENDHRCEGIAFLNPEMNHLEVQ